MTMRWTTGSVAGLLALSLGLAVHVDAQADSTQIFACVNNSSGEVKIVAPGAACNNNWTLRTWNVTGPAGPQGPAGPPGPPAPPPRTQPMSFAVNCDAGDTIQGALASDLIPGDVLLVSGICHENVNVASSAVARDIPSITLDGQNAATIVGSTSAPTVRIVARGITVRNFTIQGGQDGITVLRGGMATISGNSVDGSNGARDGIVATQGAVATIDANVVWKAKRFGINLDQGGIARITNNSVEQSGSDGILVDEGSSARIGFSTFVDPAASPNTIESSRGNGINVLRSASAVILGNAISGNAQNGVHVSDAAHADVGGNTIDGNGGDGINVMDNSTVSIGRTGLSFDGPNTTTTNNGLYGLRCVDGALAKTAVGLGTLNGNLGPAPPPNFDPSCVRRGF